MTVSQFIGGRAKAEVTYHGLGPAPDTVGVLATMDFSGVAYGPAEPRKVVSIVAFWGTPGTDAPSRAMVSATINGEVAQIDKQQFVLIPFARIYAGIVSAVVDVASGPVSLTFEGGIANTNVEIHSYSIVGLVEYPTIVDSDDADASGSTDTSLFVQTKAGGVALAAAYARNSATAFTLTGVTEDYDHSPIATRQLAGGSYESVTDEAAHEIRFQNAQNNGAVIAVSYR